MIVKFTPEQFDDESAQSKDESEKSEVVKLSDQFEGFIECKIPSYPERLRLPKEIGLTVTAEKDDGGKAEKELRTALQQLELLANCAEKIRQYIVGVNLKDKKSGAELKSVDDLYCYPDASGFVTHLCSKFILGFLTKK